MTQNYENLCSAVENIRGDVDKAEKGNKAAGTRVRKAMQDLKAMAQDVRVQVQDMKNS